MAAGRAVFDLRMICTGVLVATKEFVQDGYRELTRSDLIEQKTAQDSIWYDVPVMEIPRYQ
jgi:hypothetical protein